MAQNGTANAVDTTGKVPEGVVLPPKDIRAIVEKTAGYVARNGPVFEDRIRDKEQSNSKFSFLTPGDAYAPFYEWRLSEVRAGRNADLSGKTGAAGAAPAKPKGPEPPPEYQFSARMPNISALDLEVLKLTALHTARKGKSWMTILSQKEARNYQFDFLRPQHSLYNFFQRMVDQYSLILQTGPEGQKAEQARIKEVQENIQDRFRVLNKARKRAEYVKHQEKQKQQKEEAEEAERIAYAQIDWHDFVVVETVTFTEADDQADLPPPTTLNDLQSASLEQKAMMSLSRPDMRIEEAMPDADLGSYAGYTDNYEYAYNAAQPQYPGVAMPQPPTVPSPAHPFAQQHNYVPFPTASPQPQIPSPAPQPAQREPAPMRIRQDYVPRAQQRVQQSQQTSICPNCKQKIPIAELEEHLRIELLDPQWQEQQRKNAERFSSTGVAGLDVVANLKRLRAQADGGSSDPVAEAAARVLDDDEERRKRAKGASGDAVVYPTGAPTVPREHGKGLSVDEQIRNLQSRYGA